MAAEYLSGGTLKNFLRKQTEDLSLQVVSDVATDIASAMKYLHSKVEIK